MNRIERLEKILNETSGNPYHDSEGKFTFSPSSFKNTSGKDAEVTDNPRDWYLTDLSRKNINKIPEISSTKELKDYLSSNGINSDIDNPAIKKYEDYENIEFDALKKQASGIVASLEFCKAVFGKESLSKLKEIKFYSSEAETTGSFDVMLKGEKPSKTNGTMELSTDITNRGILHEFIHVVQDSTKKKSQDSVLWSKEILDKTGVNSKAYAGANRNHLAAEQLADLISFGIANGKNLEDVSKVINYIRKNKTENSIQLNGGPGSGNFNPGQGRGVGKPSNHSINTDISKSGLTHKSGEATAGYTGTTSASIINDLLRQGLDTKDYQSVIDRLDSNMEEIKVDTLLKRGVSFNFLKANSEAFGITEDMSYKEVQKNIIGKSFKELGYSSATYGDESDYGSIHLKIKCPKGTKALWTGNDKEKEVIISRGTTFKINNYRRENEDDAWSKIIVDLEVISQDDLNRKNNMIKNGGLDSGNFNPGQGRDKGKPNNSSFKTISAMNYDKMVEDGFSFLDDKNTKNSRIGRLNELSLKINGGVGSGNFNPGQGRGVGKPGKGSSATKIYEKYKDRKNPKPKSLSDEERELRIGTIINNAERMGINLEDIKKDDAYKIMRFIGWEENKNGTVSTEFGLGKISDKEIKDDDYIVFNGTDSKDGFDSLRDGGYRSRIIDENDGPGIYTSEYYDTALEYSKGEGDKSHKERVTPIRINNSNIISRDDVNKKLRNFNRSFLKNLPDSAVAAMAGYDAMWTGNGDKEVVILKPSSAEIIELDEK